MATGTSGDNSQEVHKQGYAVFIVNIHKYGNYGDFEFEERKGAREDLNIHSVFLSLGFEWINNTPRWHESLPLERWDHRFKKGDVVSVPSDQCCLCCRIQALDHSKSKCFVLVISSHGRELTGRETEIIFSDGRSVSLTQILEVLNDENCPSLKGKPRVIILQACRSNFEDTEIVGRMQDTGVTLNETTTDQAASGSETVSSEGAQQDDPIVDYTFQQAALQNMPENFMLVYPVVSGQRSQRNEQHGSWLIQGLVEIYFQSYDKEKPVNFFHLLTEVSGKIAREKETIVYKRDKDSGKVKLDEDGNPIIDKEKSGIKNAVISYHKLRKPLVFYPKTKETSTAPPSLDFGKKTNKKKTGINTFTIKMK